MQAFTVVVSIVAPDLYEALALRDEIVGAIEDNRESDRIFAEAIVGQLESSGSSTRAISPTSAEENGMRYRMQYVAKVGSVYVSGMDMNDVTLTPGQSDAQRFDRKDTSELNATARAAGARFVKLKPKSSPQSTF